MKRSKYLNLEAELSRAGINKSALARSIGISSSSMYAKIRGERDFKITEIDNIISMLSELTDQELTVDYLFKPRL